MFWMILLQGCRPDALTAVETTTTDADSDGFPVDPATGTADCDDNDPTIYPGAPETCDGVDEDCDGEIDEEPVDDAWVDDDGDGYGTTLVENTCPGSGLSAEGGDCNDDDTTIHPDAPDLCEGIDYDCNGVIADPYDLLIDADSDGWWVMLDACQEGAISYGEFAKLNAQLGDCDDTSAAAYPGAEEVCGDGIANDCETFQADQECFDFTVTECPSFWPLDTLDGLRVQLAIDVNETLTFSSGAEDAVRGVQAWWFIESYLYAYSSKHDYSNYSIGDAWSLSCTEAGVVRLKSEWWESYNSYSSTSYEEGIEHYDNLPLALPAVVEEGVTWEEIGVRYPFGVMNTAESEPDYAIEHTVTGCREIALPDVGTRTVCTIESTGGVGTWTVAEGLGPVGLGDAMLAEVAWE